MFNNMQVSKDYTVTDNITQNKIPVATFNATLHKDSGIYMNMNITYPNLYDIHKDSILVDYRAFTSDVTALAVTMGLATIIETDPSILDDLESIRLELTEIATDTFNQVIASLGDVQVNPTPSMDVPRY